MGSRKQEWRALLLIMALALGLRLVNLGGRPLWYDEAFSLLYAELSPTEMRAGTLGTGGAAAEEHPLLYYTLLHGWLALFGNSPAAARLLSALLGTGTAGLVYLLGRQLGTGRVAFLAALVVALSPFHVYYSQEARMYALLASAAVATILFFVRAWQYGWLNWLGFSLSGVLLLYSHNLGILVLLALGLWVLYAWWRGPRWAHWQQLVLATLVMLLLFLPWLLVLPRQLAKLEGAYWVQAPGFTELVQTLLIFHFAYDNQALPSWLLVPALFLSLLLTGVLLLQLARQPRSVRRDPGVFPYPAALLLLLSLGTVTVAFLISQLQPIYVVRALLPAALFYYLLLVRSLRAAPRPIQLLLGAAALFVATGSLWSHYTYTSFPRAPFDEVTALLAADGDPVIHSNKLTFLPAYYEAPDLEQRFIADAPGSPSDTLDPATQQALGIAESASLESALPTAGPFWIILFEQAVAEYAAGGQPHPHLAQLESLYGPPVEEARFGDLLLYKFR
jgi:mannosyltransferase